MTFSYTQPPNGVFITDKDEVRFLIRDTVETDESISDEEIIYLLKDSEDRVYLAASKAAMAVANNYSKAAQVTSRSVGDLSISNSFKEVANEYRMLSKDLLLGRKTTANKAFFIDSDREFSIGQFDQLRP